MKKFIYNPNHFDLKASDIKSREVFLVKKSELLLEFDLSEDATIQRRDKNYDRDSVLKILDAYWKNGKFLFEIDRIEGLYDFLIKYEIITLKVSDLGKLSQPTKDWLKPYFNYAYKKLATKLIADSNNLSASFTKKIGKKIKHLHNYLDREYLNESTLELTYSSSLEYDELRKEIDGKYWTKEHFLQIFPKIEKHCSLRRSSMIKLVLFDNAEGLDFSYLKLVQKIINISFDSVHGVFSLYPVTVLKSIRSLILCLNNYNTPISEDLNKIKDYLDTMIKQKEFRQFYLIYISIISFIFLLIYLLILLATN